MTTYLEPSLMLQICEVEERSTTHHLNNSAFINGQAIDCMKANRRTYEEKHCNRYRGKRTRYERASERPETSLQISVSQTGGRTPQRERDNSTKGNAPSRAQTEFFLRTSDENHPAKMSCNTTEQMIKNAIQVWSHDDETLAYLTCISSPTRQVFRGTRVEFMTRQPRVRYLHDYDRPASEVTRRVSKKFGIVERGEDFGFHSAKNSACDVLVVKVTACHEFEPSTSEDRLCREVMHASSVEAPTSSRWILSSDITPATDGYEKNNTPPLSRTPSEIRGVRRNCPTPRQRGELTA
ncbi:hypothetical protein TNCV_410941 [Trichonephila clavipes]|nr:hypothetical protein TNCV_410941 [Trichonephila clavipes]